MAEAPKANIQPARVAAVNPAEGKGHGVFPFGNHYQVNVIGHQAVAQDLQLCVCCGGRQQVQIGLAILFVMEDVAPKVAALGYVVRVANGHHSAHSCHHP